MRVVSLVPSLTDTLLAWDVVPVAVTRFCEQPHLRPVGGTKDPDIGAIVALGPDLVVVNDEGRIERFLEKPTSGQVFSDPVNAGIYVLEPDTFDRIPADTQ